MKSKYDLLRAIGAGIRDLMPPSAPPSELQILMIRLATREDARAIAEVVTGLPSSHRWSA
jgi:hypothetical protein